MQQISWVFFTPIAKHLTPDSFSLISLVTWQRFNPACQPFFFMAGGCPIFQLNIWWEAPPHSCLLTGVLQKHCNRWDHWIGRLWRHDGAFVLCRPSQLIGWRPSTQRALPCVFETMLSFSVWRASQFLEACETTLPLPPLSFDPISVRNFFLRVRVLEECCVILVGS